MTFDQKAYQREYMRTYGPEWIAKNPEKRRAITARYRETHPDEVRASRHAYYLKNKLRHGVSMSATRRRNREITDTMKARPCADCGREFPPYVMDFDHRDRNDKQFNIGDLRQSSTKKLLAEIAKCDVVCANCHRIRTYRTMWRPNISEVA